MTDPHEDLVEAVARVIYEEWGYAYEGRTVGPNGPYGNWAISVRSARDAVALIAERTKDATPEMLSHALYGFPLGEQWEKMHRASALWPKEKP